jgi:hypothetical protein
MALVDRAIRTFKSFAEAEAQEHAEYAALSPDERVDILLELIARYRESLGEAAEGFERVHRIVELSKS